MVVVRQTEADKKLGPLAMQPPFYRWEHRRLLLLRLPMLLPVVVILCTAGSSAVAAGQLPIMSPYEVSQAFKNQTLLYENYY